jgi:hypothetical protein
MIARKRDEHVFSFLKKGNVVLFDLRINLLLQ